MTKTGVELPPPSRQCESMGDAAMSRRPSWICGRVACRSMNRAKSPRERNKGFFSPRNSTEGRSTFLRVSRMWLNFWGFLMGDSGTRGRILGREGYGWTENLTPVPCAELKRAKCPENGGTIGVMAERRS